MIISPCLSLTVWMTRSDAEGNHKYGMPSGGCAKRMLVYCCSVAVSPVTEPIISSFTFDTIEPSRPVFVYENIVLLFCRHRPEASWLISVVSLYFSSSRTRCWWRAFLHSCSLCASFLGRRVSLCCMFGVA